MCIRFPKFLKRRRSTKKDETDGDSHDSDESAQGSNLGKCRYATVTDLRPPRYTSSPPNRAGATLDMTSCDEVDADGERVAFPSVKLLVQIFESQQQLNGSNWHSTPDDTIVSISQLQQFIDAARCQPEQEDSVGSDQWPPSQSTGDSYDREMSPEPLLKQKERCERWQKYKGMDFNETLNSLVNGRL
ncbi:hypothetical protein QR680_010721 [Steinernema hermaphroditum]|uniref:Uncharacterized protein n=1 Tax=Steinernema hermaphroditum TaxID=289476 RepID=A0AA39IRC5_9BILA|nr:hypothetical protein QR680_010721 [Steinernema hermaphroditum]